MQATIEALGIHTNFIESLRQILWLNDLHNHLTGVSTLEFPLKTQEFELVMANGKMSFQM